MPGRARAYVLSSGRDIEVEDLPDWLQAENGANESKPEVVSGLLGVFLRAVETTVRQNSPDAPIGARFGAVAFVYRFGSYLNSHVHFHVMVTDGVSLPKNRPR